MDHISTVSVSPGGPRQAAHYSPPSLARAPAKPIADKTFLTGAYSRCLAYLPHFNNKKLDVKLYYIFKAALPLTHFLGDFLRE